jgi:hypothetical protein
MDMILLSFPLGQRFESLIRQLWNSFFERGNFTTSFNPSSSRMLSDLLK